ncbi:hypothetical protein DSC47_19510 [Elizabethkingia miricola]|nr:hypothetical protein BAY07_09235 [Elizabethkingia bruuniana]OPC58033.1 hypothetical protein BAY13_13500 [Elizabethkingia bruuniana]RBI89419.1 hypothetical protein DSC47_19510 [Elizabethkingia miricola]
MIKKNIILRQARPDTPKRKLFWTGNVTLSQACNEPVYSELDELNYRRVLTIKFKQALKIRINRQQ